MFLICYGTRPEIIKVFPLIKAFQKNNIKFKTLFSGQHPDLYKQFVDLMPKPDFILNEVMEHGQSLNKLSSKILVKVDDILCKNRMSVAQYNNCNLTDNDSGGSIEYVIVQGDTTTAYSIAFASFHNKIKVIHLEAGLRTHDKFSPFPEEINRCLISKIADIHLCPTLQSVLNLKEEGITDNVFQVGNTVVDSYKYIMSNFKIPENIEQYINNGSYYLVTLHRRENRGKRMTFMWKQLNELAEEGYQFVYIKHPSLKEVTNHLIHKNIVLLEPVDYVSMVFLIGHSQGIITDSGGLQEEATCANKKVLICRDTTERPETIDSGYGKLVSVDIKDNMTFLNSECVTENSKEVMKNPYGEDVCEKIVNILYSQKK